MCNVMLMCLMEVFKQFGGPWTVYSTPVKSIFGLYLGKRFIFSPGHLKYCCF